MTAWLFVTLVLVMAWLVFRALRLAGGGAAVRAAITFAYLVAPAGLAAAGMLDRYDPLPAPVLVMVLILTAITMTITLSPFGGRVMAAVGLPALVAYQVFRIPVEWLLYRLYDEGVVPVQMTYVGRNFDIVTGMTAAALGVWLMRGSRPRAVVLAWNVLGFALLVNIVTIAILSTPVPFRRFVDGPPNLLPSVVPYVWLPSFLVQVALAGHILVFRSVLSAGGSIERSA